MRSITGLIEASNAIYKDSANRFQQTIAQNLLQIFFLDTYDKVQRLFTQEQIEGSNRKDELFKKFINLVHTHCVTQRDVTFYAEQLCISTRYLSAITKEMGKTTAKEIIDDFLILELKVALQSTGLSLKEIAENIVSPTSHSSGDSSRNTQACRPRRSGPKRHDEEKRG